MKSNKKAFYFLVTPVLIWLVFLIIIPHMDLLISSFKAENDAGELVFSLENYTTFFKEKIYWLTFLNTAACHWCYAISICSHISYRFLSDQSSIQKVRLFFDSIATGTSMGRRACDDIWLGHCIG